VARRALVFRAIDLPYEETVSASPTQPPNGASGTRCSVLIVEDDPDIRLAIAGLLEEDGYQAVSKADGAEALAWLREASPRPCLMLLDLRMPVMDGTSLLNEVRATPSLHGLPVCVLSADPAPPLGGADWVLQKPVTADSLMRIVQRLCCRLHGGATGKTPPVGVPTATGALAPR
jgi:CheY-like chemotaxis protein